MATKQEREETTYLITFLSKSGRLAGSVWTHGMNPSRKRGKAVGFGGIIHATVHDQRAELYRGIVHRLDPGVKPMQIFDVLATPNNGSFNGAMRVIEDVLDASEAWHW